MKSVISALFYMIIVSIYLTVQDCEIIFMFFAWLAGYFKQYFYLKEDE